MQGLDGCFYFPVRIPRALVGMTRKDVTDVPAICDCSLDVGLDIREVLFGENEGGVGHVAQLVVLVLIDEPTAYSTLAFSKRIRLFCLD